ncbi:baculoviral IAP repeat-containing protein 7 [Elysia marginata]|uniref:Baculoviral IAP repeat-containing protein 7 n=1 Tax=Elysia marginata TaxID=1093978 RepID=A0AAV4ERW8_9GAST|nr:baculoviral IAP repeat-containing protein 7 [Elysia marginata]
MEALQLIILFSVVISFLALCLGNDSQCQPHDFLASTTCDSCQPCPTSAASHVSPVETCRAAQVPKHTRHIPWRSVTFSYRRRRSQFLQRRSKTKSSSDLPKFEDGALANVRNRDVSNGTCAPQVSSGLWFLGNPRRTGLERSAALTVGTRKQSCWVALALLLLLVVPQAMLIVRVKQSIARVHFFVSQQKSESLHLNWRTLLNGSERNETKLSSSNSEQKFFGSGDKEMKQFWSDFRKRNDSFLEDLISSFHGEVFRSQHDVEALNVQPLPIARLASYQKFPPVPLPTSISFLVLAQAGFRYSGQETRVCCDGCNSSLEISDFSETPSSQRYHDRSCEFLGESNNSRQSSDDTLGAGADCTDDTLGAGASTWPTGNSDTEPGCSSEPSAAQEVPVPVTYTTNAVTSQQEPKSPLYSTKNSSPGASAEFIDTDAERVYSREQGIPSLPTSVQPVTDNANSVYTGGSSAYAASDSSNRTGEQTAPSHLEGKPADSPEETSWLPGSDGADAASGSNVDADGSASGKQSQAFTGSGASSNISYSSSVFVPGSRYCHDAEMTMRYFDGTDLFETEGSRERQTPFRPEKVRDGDCEKNPGHLSYWSPQAISERTLPDFAASRQFCRFLSLVAELTVRVVVGYTSPARRRWHDVTDQCKGEKYRTGTGSAIREPQFDDNDTSVECDAVGTPPTSPTLVNPPAGKTKSKKSSKIFKGTLPKAPLKAVRKYASNRKKKKCTLYIETNRHIVFDDAEAAETSVEFYFDQPDRKSVYTLKVTSVMHDVSLSGGNRSILVCSTPDLSFVQSLRAKRRELELLVGQFPNAARDALLKHVFLVHHPHGGEKVCSFGKSVVKKYVLERAMSHSGPENASSIDQVSHSKLAKISNLKQIPRELSSTRKLLLYTADTCRGSSGAPVVGFTNTGSSSDGTPNLALTLWMHEGKEVNGPLNVSVMEACTTADLAPLAPSPRPKPLTLTLPMPGPVIRMQNPTYYVYSSLRKRLESFSGVLPQTFVHSIYDLAKGGFFYAGYGDCVRCFYCGVGLKRWGQNDDMYAEHQRLRPDCHFLILQMRAMGASGRSAVSSIAADQSQAASSTLASLPSAREPPGSPPSKPSCPNFDKPTVKAASVCSQLGSGLVPCQSQREVTAYPVTGMTFTPNCNVSTCSGLPALASATGGVSAGDVTSTPLEADDKSRLQVAMLQTENAILERPLTCKVCNSAPVRELYLPCGHLDTCSECTQTLDNCPTCCARIRATVKIYFA